LLNTQKSTGVQGAAYIPIVKARGITPRLVNGAEKLKISINRQLHQACGNYGMTIDESISISNIVNMLGLECRNEVHTANGRMDCVIFAGGHIYVFEFKVDKPVEGALWQLEEKDYASIYADSGKDIVQIGVTFSREQRNILQWEVR